jgi:hypothetical protein
VNPIPAALAVGVLSTLGHWADGKGPTIKTVVGVAALAITLTVLSGANVRLGQAFGLLVVTAVAFVHAPKILAKVDL